MNKQEWAKNIYLNLTPEKKDDARECIRKKYGVTSESVKNNWIYKMAIPDDYLDFVLTTLQEKAKKQAEELIKIAIGNE